VNKYLEKIASIESFKELGLRVGIPLGATIGATKAIVSTPKDQPYSAKDISKNTLIGAGIGGVALGGAGFGVDRILQRILDPKGLSRKA
jgi:hypothetical protein